MVYPWTSGVTYRFLTQVHPDTEMSDCTLFTSWFHDPDNTSGTLWTLIASFRRPKLITWFTGPYSFLENFQPETGYLTRRGYFGNQWAVTDRGEWIEVNEAEFTYDTTAKNGERADYMGGLAADDKRQFVLQNCGFFDDNTEYGSSLKRTQNNIHPDIDVTTKTRDRVVPKRNIISLLCCKKFMY